MRTLGLAVFLVTGAVNLQLPRYAALASDAGLDAGGMALLLGGYGAALMVALTLLAGLPDRLGVRSVAMAALGCAGLACVITATVPTVWGLAVARWLQGLGVALGMGACTAWARHRSDADRAARLTGWASTAGFGAGPLLAAAWTPLTGGPTEAAYGAWALAISLAGVAVGLLGYAPPVTEGAPLLRPPAYPAGTGVAALAIGAGWAVAGTVVAVLPGVLDAGGRAGWAGPLLALLLASGLLAQPLARRWTPSRSIAAGSLLLTAGTALLAAGVATGAAWPVLAGVALAGTSTHGLGYVGALRRSAVAAGSTARNVSGTYLAAYVGFTLPAVVVGTAADRLGPAMAFLGLAALVGAASAVVTAWARPMPAAAG